MAQKTRFKHHVHPDDPEKAALYELERLDWHGGGIDALIQDELELLAESRPYPENRVEEALANLLISLARASVRVRPNTPLHRELGGLAVAYAIGFLRFEDLIRPDELEEAFMEVVHVRVRLRDKRQRSKTRHTRSNDEWLKRFAPSELNAMQLGELCWMERKQPTRWEKEGLLRRGPNGGYLRQDYIKFLGNKLEPRRSEKIDAVLSAYYKLEWEIKKQDQQSKPAAKAAKTKRRKK